MREKYVEEIRNRYAEKYNAIYSKYSYARYLQRDAMVGGGGVVHEIKTDDKTGAGF